MIFIIKYKKLLIWSDFGCGILTTLENTIDIYMNNYNVITTFEVNSKELNKGLVHYNNDKNTI
jgi:hypothetical protein